MKINKKKADCRWVNYDGEGDVAFYIRPFPFSILKLNNDVVDNIKINFDHCLQGWKGLVDDDDNTLEYNDENKGFIFDYCEEIREFIFEKSKEMAIEINDEIKN